MDPMSLYAVGSTVAGLAGSAMSYKGAREANVMNIAEARGQQGFQSDILGRQERFQRESQGRQMAFQERMSNTAYQRAMQDMRTAGLNPILAYSQGGASTPSGSVTSGATAQGSKARLENVYAPAVNTGLSALRTAAEIQLLEANAMSTMAKADVTKKESSWYNIKSSLSSVKDLISGAANLGTALTIGKKLLGR